MIWWQWTDDVIQIRTAFFERQPQCITSELIHCHITVHDRRFPARWVVAPMKHTHWIKSNPAETPAWLAAHACQDRTLQKSQIRYTIGLASASPCCYFNLTLMSCSRASSLAVLSFDTKMHLCWFCHQMTPLEIYFLAWCLSCPPKQVPCIKV